MNIRKAEKKDLPEILDIQKKAFYSEAVLYNDFEISPLHQTIEEVSAEFDHKTILVCEHNGRIIASVRFYVENDNGYIGKLIVLPEFQNQGIGRTLMTEVEKYFQNCIRIELFTGSRSEKNIHLYQSMGYTVYDTIKETENVILVKMEKYIKKNFNSNKE